MGFDVTDLREEKNKRITFPNGKYLDIGYRIKAMPYSKKKVLMDNVFALQGNAQRAKRLTKDLENQSLSDVERERNQSELAHIAETAHALTEPLVDYLVGTAKRPGALISWDLTDNGEPVAITRESITELLDEETITFIAWQLFGDNEVGKQNGSGSQTPSDQASQATSTAPA